MILLLVLGLLIRRCWKDFKETCEKFEVIATWSLLAVYFFLMFYFSKQKGDDEMSTFGIVVFLCLILAFIELHR